MAQRVNIEVLNKAAVDVTVQNSNAINVEVPTAPRGLSAEFTANQTEINVGEIVDFSATNPGFQYLFSIEDVGGFFNKIGKTVSHQFLDSGNFDVALTQADLNQQASGIQVKRDFIKVNETPFILNQAFGAGATAAYSLRKLKSSATKAVRVREDGANTETNIGFNNINELDETALLNHCGSANGFVTKWYDQSGNGNDASNPTAIEQPQIVDSGSIIKKNGKPGVQTDGSDDFLDAGAIITQPDFTIFLEGVCINTNKSSETLSLANESVDDDLYSIQVNNDVPRASIYEKDFYDVRANSINLNSNFLSTAIYTGNVTLDFYSNGSKAGSITDSQPQGIDNFVIGALRRGLNNNGDSYHDGFFQEIIAYKADKSSDRNKIETNINNHYSIF